MTTIPAVLRRSLLYVPSSSQRMIEKSRNLVVDNVTYDLEDSVAINKKPDARVTLHKRLDEPRSIHIKEQGVRINSISSGLAEQDLNEVLEAQHIDTLIIPKVNSASDLDLVTDMLRYKVPARHPSTRDTSAESRPIQILALIESAKSIMNLSAICKASPYLSGLIFAAEDFALDLSLERTPSLAEFLFARSSIVTACRAHELPSIIDLVCTRFRGEEGRQTLEEECLGGRKLGFNGKQCIHPCQVGIVQRLFTPSEGEIEWATKVVVANAKAIGQGRGAWALDSQMIDAPVVEKAWSIIKKAKACNVDLQPFKKDWNGQEPE